MVYMGTLTLLPLVLQSNLGYTATWAGLAAAPIGFLPIFLSPLIGRFGNKIDMRLLVTGSFLMFAFTFHWRTDFYAGMDMSSVVWPHVLAGFGCGQFFLPLTTITLSHMKRSANRIGKQFVEFSACLYGWCRCVCRQYHVGAEGGFTSYATD